MIRTFIPYATVSLAVLLLDMTVFTLLIQLDWNPLVATFLGYTSGHIFNFSLARRYVFDKGNVTSSISVEFLHVTYIAFAGLVANMGIMALLTGFGADAYLARIFAVSASFIINYLLKKYIVYAEEVSMATKKR